MAYSTPLRVALLAIAFSLLGCTESAPTPPDTAPAAPDGTPALHDQEATPPTTAFERIRDGIPGQGAAGASAAWDAGKPAFLLFAASW